MAAEPEWLANSRLARQSFGIACAQATFGGPRGIWLECRCGRSDVIVGSKPADGEWGQRSNADAARVFRKHGWTGEGENMTGQRCPDCSGPADTVAMRHHLDLPYRFA